MFHLKTIQKLVRYRKSLGLSLVLILLLAQVNYLFLYRPFLWDKWVSHFKKDKPQILQVVYGSLIENEIDIKVIKKKFKNKIYLEFLSQNPDGSSKLINSIPLRGVHESYFEYWNQTLSLALLDEDGDGQLDVIAPTTDSYFKPYINIVSYSKDSKIFQLKEKATFPHLK